MKHIGINFEKNYLVPDYINEKGNVVRLIVLTAAFALLFLNIYQPFSSKEWAGNSDWVYFLYSSLIILVGMCVIAISRWIMYRYHKTHDISIFLYAFWVMMEIASMSLVYAIFQVYVLDDMEVSKNFLSVWKSGINKTSLVLLLPYTILWLYFAMRDKAKMLEKIREQETEMVGTVSNDLICFYDEKGVLRLSVDKESLYYLESADNYVKIFYLSKGRLQHFMLRNSLKNIDELMSQKGLLRCHRSFMVNFDKVKVLRKGEDGLSLDMDNENVPNIPVSKTYSARVMERFTSGSKS